jgi:osmotically-inducible protein OsmY
LNYRLRWQAKPKRGQPRFFLTTEEDRTMVFKEQTFHGRQPEAEADYTNRATLEAAVANALAVAGGIDASDVEVTAEGDEIVLSGHVGTVEEIERATVIARTVEGVHTVRNRILLVDPTVNVRH